MKRVKILFFMILLLMLVLSGCADDTSNSGQPVTYGDPLPGSEEWNEKHPEPEPEPEPVVDEQAIAEGRIGEMDLIDKDGYTWHVSWDISQSFTKDTTKGKPGEVGVNVNLAGTCTITNTTQGKEAPVPSLEFFPVTIDTSYAENTGQKIWISPERIHVQDVGSDFSMRPLYKKCRTPLSQNLGLAIGARHSNLGVGETRTIKLANFDIYNNSEYFEIPEDIYFLATNPTGWIVCGWVYQEQQYIEGVFGRSSSVNRHSMIYVSPNVRQSYEEQ